MKMNTGVRNTEIPQSTRCVDMSSLFYNSQFNTTSHGKLLKKMKQAFEKVTSVLRIFYSVL
jgi:hypothetical protein